MSRIISSAILPCLAALLVPRPGYAMRVESASDAPFTVIELASDLTRGQRPVAHSGLEEFNIEQFLASYDEKTKRLARGLQVVGLSRLLAIMATVTEAQPEEFALALPAIDRLVTMLMSRGVDSYAVASYLPDLSRLPPSLQSAADVAIALELAAWLAEGGAGDPFWAPQLIFNWQEWVRLIDSARNRDALSRFFDRLLEAGEPRIVSQKEVTETLRAKFGIVKVGATPVINRERFVGIMFAFHDALMERRGIRRHADHYLPDQYGTLYGMMTALRASLTALRQRFPEATAVQDAERIWAQLERTVRFAEQVPLVDGAVGIQQAPGRGTVVADPWARWLYAQADDLVRELHETAPTIEPRAVTERVNQATAWSLHDPDFESFRRWARAWDRRYLEVDETMPDERLPCVQWNGGLYYLLRVMSEAVRQERPDLRFILQGVLRDVAVAERAPDAATARTRYLEGAVPGLMRLGDAVLAPPGAVQSGSEELPTVTPVSWPAVLQDALSIMEGV